MKRRSLTLALTAAAAALGLAVTGCSGPSGTAPSGEQGASDGAVLRMGTQPWIGYGPWYVADEQGFFDDRGLNVDITSFNADAEMNAALAGGRLDMGNVGSQAALQFMEQGLDVSIVLLLDSATTADAILAGPDLESAADLAGKTVAYEEGATSEILLAEALDTAGLTFDDITAVPTDADNVTPILLAGRADAGVTYEPYVSEALGAGQDLQVLESAGDYPGIISDVLVVRNEVLQERGDEVRELLAAWGDAIAFGDTDEDAFREIIAKGVGAEATELTTAFEGVRFYSLEDNRSELTGAYVEETLPTLIEIATRIGLISAEVEPEQAIDASFLGN